jgi:hypothetical protein
MVVRIRFGRQTRVGLERRRTDTQARAFALGLASLLSPAAFMSLVLCLWRIAADLDWAGRFAISSGVFSHWQAWMVVAALLQFCARILTRYGRSGTIATP